MLRLKDCPKCGGDLYGEPDVEGIVNCCIQCGLRQYSSLVAGADEKQGRSGRHRGIDSVGSRGARRRAPETVDHLRRPVIVLLRNASGALVRRVVSMPLDQLAELQERQAIAREPIA